MIIPKELLHIETPECIVNKIPSLVGLFIFNNYGERFNTRCEPPKTLAPPLTNQTTAISSLC